MENGIPEGLPPHIDQRTTRVSKEIIEERFIAMEREDRARANDRILIRKREARDRFLRQTGSLYANCTFRNYACDEPNAEGKKNAKRVVVDYVDQLRHESGTNIWLSGTPGTGKDHLLVAAAETLMDIGETVDWRSGPDLWAEFRDGMTEQRKEEAILGPLTTAGILVISDPLGVSEVLSEYRREKLYQIVDRRGRHRRPTWISCNIPTRAAAVAAFGQATLDRICGGAVKAVMAWESYRGKEPI